MPWLIRSANYFVERAILLGSADFLGNVPVSDVVLIRTLRGHVARRHSGNPLKNLIIGHWDFPKKIVWHKSHR